jgi:prepilin signal peptidase PulO-like enzyme (type II secretory pathway)
MYLALLHLFILFAAIAVFVYIAWQDWHTMEIPDRSHVILIGLALLQMLAGGAIPFGDRALGLLAMSLPMVLMNCLRGDSFGGGDIKMCGAAGFFLGAPQMTTGALIGLFLAGIYGGLALSSGKKKLKDTFPLGPFLSLGFVGSTLAALVEQGF